MHDAAGMSELLNSVQHSDRRLVSPDFADVLPISCAYIAKTPHALRGRPGGGGGGGGSGLLMLQSLLQQLMCLLLGSPWPHSCHLNINKGGYEECHPLPLSENDAEQACFWPL